MRIFGAIGGIKIGRGNRSTRRKPAPAPLCPPQNPTWPDPGSNPGPQRWEASDWPLELWRGPHTTLNVSRLWFSSAVFFSDGSIRLIHVKTVSCIQTSFFKKKYEGRFCSPLTKSLIGHTKQQLRISIMFESVCIQLPIMQFKPMDRLH
jgi:hypothetical protein